MIDLIQRLSYWALANQQSIKIALAKNDWIKSMRQFRALSGRDFAVKLNVSPPRVSVLERDELTGSVTLKMMQKSAEALDCEFVYFLVPKAALNEATGSSKPRLRAKL